MSLTSTTRTRSDAYLTPEEVAQRLRVNTATVWRMIRQGEIRAVQVRRRYRISQEDLDAFLQRNEVRPDAGEGAAS